MPVQTEHSQSQLKHTLEGSNRSRNPGLKLGSGTHATACERPRFEILDVLRFGAALAVVFFHFGFRGWFEHRPGYVPFPMLASVAKYGYLGVDAFFLISGFVILFTATNRGAGGFVSSRLTRLYPAYWACVCIAFVGSFLHSDGSDGEAWLIWLVNLSMLQEFVGLPNVDGVYWTFVVELRFYLILFVLLLVRQIDRIESTLWLWLIALLACDYKLLPHVLWLDDVLIGAWAHYFIAGACFYLVWLRGMNFTRALLLLLCAARASQHAYWYMLLKVRLTGVWMDRPDQQDVSAHRGSWLTP